MAKVKYLSPIRKWFLGVHILIYSKVSWLVSFMNKGCVLKSGISG